MSYLLKQGKCLLLTFLQDWLDCKDVAHLELSITSKSEKKTFLDFVTDQCIKRIKYTPEILLCQPLLDWLDARYAKLTQVWICAKSFENDIFTRGYFSSIQSIVATNLTPNCEENLTKMLYEAVQLTDLTLQTSQNEVDVNLLKQCSLLTKVDISKSTNINNNIFLGIGKHCKNLSYLSVAHCVWFNDSDLTIIVDSCSFLTHLNVNGCTELTDKSIVLLGQECSKIEALDIGDLPLIKLEAVHSLIESCHFLVSLGLSNNIVRDSTLKHIVTHLPNLSTLDLSSCSNVTHNGIVALCSGCRLITDLNLASYLPTRSYNEIGKSLSGLRKIEFDSDDSAILITMCHWFSALTRMDMTQSVLEGTHFSEDRLEVLAQTAPQRNDCQVGEFCQSMATKGAKLQHLVVSAAGFGINDVNVLIVNCGRELLSLDLSACNALANDDLLLTVAQHCSQLTVLNISHHVNVTDIGVVAVLQRNTELRDLNCTGCSKLTDQSVVAIAQCCRKIAELWISFCPLITDDSIAQLAARCKKLRRVSLIGCDALTPGAAESLRRRCPALEDVMTEWSLKELLS